jgi:hypothetical protein
MRSRYDLPAIVNQLREQELGGLPRAAALALMRRFAQLRNHSFPWKY